MDKIAQKTPTGVLEGAAAVGMLELVPYIGSIPADVKDKLLSLRSFLNENIVNNLQSLGNEDVHIIEKSSVVHDITIALNSHIIP